MSGDPELEAMSAVSGALAPLDPEVQGRVLRWAVERFGVAIAASGHNIGRGADSGEDADVLIDEEVPDEAPAFEHFGELFAAADPKSLEDKALLAAYWTQVHEGHDSWPSRLLNAKLKPLGHNIGNITQALTGNFDRRPQRIILLGKGAAGAKANKMYKVTSEGITYVQALLNTGRG